MHAIVPAATRAFPSPRTLTLTFTLTLFTLTLTAAALDFSPGAGVFEYTSDEVHTGLEMRVFYHAPETIDASTSVWFVIHGAGRNAEGYRNSWIDFVKDDDVLVLAPEFTTDGFPGSHAYNLGNTVARGEFRPEPEWTYSIVERLFDHVRDNLGLDAETYLIYGHSAGSQFTHRMLFLMSETRAEAAFIANAGWYTMPDLDTPFPYGLGGTPADPERLKGVFNTPVVVLLGDRDTDTEHHQLRRTDGAMAQGPHRLARGKSFFEAARAKAAELDTPFAWTLEVVEGVAHSNRGMARAASRAMREHSRSVAEKEGR